MSFTNPMGWPEDVLPLFERGITCECSTFRRDGTPITWPLTPYMGADGRTLDVSTGLTYPAKAERARRDPRVALLYSDPVGSGLSDAHVVLVQGLATVRDADLQANTDRYVSLSMAKLPGTYKYQPAFLLRRQQWYFARIWIQVTPLRILWWPSGRTTEPAHRWEAPSGTVAPASDPAPGAAAQKGAAQDSSQDSSSEWTKAAEDAVQRLGVPVLTVVDQTGFPSPFRVERVELDPQGFHLELAAGTPARLGGSACLTFHKHEEVFVGEENKTFVGEAAPHTDGVLFRVERRLADFSFKDPRPAAMVMFLQMGRLLGPKLKSEAARRGQPIPRVRLPGDDRAAE